MLEKAKEKGYITECDKSRILTMAERYNIKATDIEKLLDSISIKPSHNAEFNRDLLPELVSFEEAKKWVEKHKQPIKIYPYGGRAQYPFHVQIKGDDLLLTGDEQNGNPSRYLLTEARWRSFYDYVEKHPNMCRGELGEKYKNYDCDDRRYWPSIISICKSM
jgi:hypothetical protein